VSGLTQNYTDVSSGLSPTYNSSGGPYGNGDISFKTTNEGLVTSESHSMDFISNGGFTFVSILKFNTEGTTTANALILLMNGNSGMIYISKTSFGNTQMNFQIVDSNGIGCNMWSYAGIHKDVWVSFVAKYSYQTNSLSLKIGNEGTRTNTCNAALSQLSFTKSHIGAGNPGFIGNIAGMFVVDALLDETEIKDIIASMHAGENLLRAGYPRIIRSGIIAGHGASAPIAFVGGDVHARLAWGAFSIPKLFTICSVTRYSGTEKKGILSCDNSNWLHGHYEANAGSTFYGGTNYGNIEHSIQPNTNWVVTCGRNLVLPRSAGTIVNDITTAQANGGNGECNLGINMVDQKTDWQFSKLYVWDYHLSDSNFALVSSSLYASLSTGKKDGVCLTCPMYSQSTTDKSACECNPGAFPTNSNITSLCSLCTIGTFKTQPGPGVCLPCPPGTYGGGITCSLCPAGTFSTNVGSMSISSCSLCKKGTYNEIQGGNSSASCLSCAAGKFHRKLGADSKSDCKECTCRK